jgi:hypothetical protein
MYTPGNDRTLGHSFLQRNLNGDVSLWATTPFFRKGQDRLGDVVVIKKIEGKDWQILFSNTAVISHSNKHSHLITVVISDADGNRRGWKTAEKTDKEAFEKLSEDTGITLANLETIRQAFLQFGVSGR